MNTIETRIRLRPRVWLAAVCFALACGPPGHAQPEALYGDVNRDGSIDILDVQGTVNMALGAATSNAEADLDLSAAVDVLDVQNITNTVLGTGGLVQRVEGSVALPEGSGTLKAVAVSEDGRVVETNADSATGDFALTLPVRTAWSLAFLAGPPGAEGSVGSVVFPIESGASVSLPLPNLSRGNTLDIGAVNLAPGSAIGEDVRDLLAETADPITFADLNGNGAPDVVEEWLLPLPLGDAAILGLSVDDEDVIELLAVLADCAESQGLEDYAPNLGEYSNGIPIAVQPLLECVPPVLEEWIRGEVDIQSWMEPLLDSIVRAISKEIEEELEDWFDDTDIPELADGNNNEVPDFIEPELCVAAAPVPGVDPSCVLDANGDGLPDFSADDNENGTANILDPETAPGDADGDGVPDATDIDDDNDGLPDYAETQG